MRCGALRGFGIPNGCGGVRVIIKRKVSMQNIRVQLSSILTGTGLHELNADILCVLASAEIRVKVGFAGKRLEEMGDDMLLVVRVGALSRAVDAGRTARKVNIIR